MCFNVYIRGRFQAEHYNKALDYDKGSMFILNSQSCGIFHPPIQPSQKGRNSTVKKVEEIFIFPRYSVFTYHIKNSCYRFKMTCHFYMDSPPAYRSYFYVTCRSLNLLLKISRWAFTFITCQDQSRFCVSKLHLRKSSGK
jgi:hypothetical protein